MNAIETYRTEILDTIKQLKELPLSELIALEPRLADYCIDAAAEVFRCVDFNRDSFVEACDDAMLVGMAGMILKAAMGFHFKNDVEAFL